uniref:Ddb1 and cul4 associated factor 17 n=1 Tax=Xiphophorus couchianus TaxID=32473 RepID=A0A3B5MW69_9TELE
MAPPRRKMTSNTADLLNQRSRGIRDTGTLHRFCLKILRSITLHENRSFIKVWSKTSKTAIMYDSGRIYFDNYQNCYSCVHDQPQNLYKFPKKSKQQKIEDALLCQSPLVIYPDFVDFVSLTADNWLCRISAETGKELQRIYLSPKYKYLAWNVSQETFYIKSVQNKETPLARQAGISQNVVMHMAIFHVFPLQIVGILEINKKVYGVTDVVMSQGVLAVSYSNKSVKLYSFEHVVQRVCMCSQSPLLGHRTVGDVPFGIPVNIQITEPPPLLFEAFSHNGIQIGGFPWHYIYTPPHKKHRGTHYICSLKDSTLAKNGIHNMNCCSLESDVIFFHPADSGRVIHIGPNTIKSFINTHVLQPSPRVTVTSSGRTVRSRFQQLDDDPMQETFRLLEYEDELDLLAIAVTNGEGEEGRAHVQLHDNQTGQLQRKIDLNEPWDEVCNIKNLINFTYFFIFHQHLLLHVHVNINNLCGNRM